MDHIGSIPIVDIGSYINATHNADFTSNLREICKTIGFFYITNHQVPADLQQQLLQNTRVFFDLPKGEKRKIHLKHGENSMRGYFELGEENTSGKIDLKEGLYLGKELDEDHPRVKDKVPLHGRNLFPQHPKKLKENLLTWQKHMIELGYHVLSAIAESLGLEKNYFRNTICKDHLGVFRLFHYPIDDKADPELWAVGEHTDYGLITLLLTTDKGLQVKSKQNEWIDVDPIPGTFVINIGDILQRITGGLYKSTPHRARNTQGKSRYSVPYFFDPDWDSEIKLLDIQVNEQEKKMMEVTKQYKRWDEADLTYLTGYYGDYLLRKMSKALQNQAKPM